MSQSRTKWKIFILTLLCGASKSFMKALKTFIKPFEAPQGSVKIKISFNFYFNTAFRNERAFRGKKSMSFKLEGSVGFKLAMCVCLWCSKQILKFLRQEWICFSFLWNYDFLKNFFTSSNYTSGVIFGVS